MGVVEGVWLRRRLTGTENSGENLSFLVGVISNIFSVGVVFLLVGVALRDDDFLFLLTGVESLGVCEGDGTGVVPGCLRGERRLVGVACDVGMVTRTTLSGCDDEEDRVVTTVDVD